MSAHLSFNFTLTLFFFSHRLSPYSLLRRPKRPADRRTFEMTTGLDMSLDDMIAKNRKSRAGTGPARGSGSGSGSGPGPTRRNNPNRKSNRSAPYQSAKVQIRSTSVLSSLFFFFFFSLVSPDLSSQICRFIMEIDSALTFSLKRFWC